MRSISDASVSPILIGLDGATEGMCRRVTVDSCSESEAGAELLRVVGICAGEVGGAVADLSRALSPY